MEYQTGGILTISHRIIAVTSSRPNCVTADGMIGHTEMPCFDGAISGQGGASAFYEAHAKHLVQLREYAASK